MPVKNFDWHIYIYTRVYFKILDLHTIGTILSDK